MAIYKKRRNPRTKKRTATAPKRRKKTNYGKHLSLFLGVFCIVFVYMALGAPRAFIIESYTHFVEDSVAPVPQQGIIITQNVRLSLWPLPFLDTGPLLHKNNVISIIATNEHWAKVLKDGIYYWLPTNKLMMATQ